MSFTILKDLWNNKILRYGVLAILIVIGLVIWDNHRMDNAYDRGKADQQAIYDKEQQTLKEEFQKRLDTANSEREDLNAELVKQKSDYAALKAKRQSEANTTRTEVIKYAQSSDGAKQCLDASWLRVYQSSLP